jgi:glutamate/tyrosine decarboxylase-like PLP-dependent enzyme
MIPEALEAAIAEDRARGLRPWLIAAAAGTTDTGAVDPLDAIATIAERERCWFHVDAAYGGFFLLTEHGRSLLKGIERSDSAVLDPHKSLFLPWGSGMVVARDGARLAATHGASGHYMQDAHREPGEASPSDVGPELSKPFRALRMWLPLILLGTKPFQAALDEKLLLARYFRREVQALGFEVGPSPDLSIVHPDRRPVHDPHGRPGPAHPPADDRSGVADPARAGGRPRELDLSPSLRLGSQRLRPATSSPGPIS